MQLANHRAKLFGILTLVVSFGAVTNTRAGDHYRHHVVSHHTVDSATHMYQAISFLHVVHASGHAHGFPLRKAIREIHLAAAEARSPRARHLLYDAIDHLRHFQHTGDGCEVQSAVDAVQHALSAEQSCRRRSHVVRHGGRGPQFSIQVPPHVRHLTSGRGVSTRQPYARFGPSF